MVFSPPFRVSGVVSPLPTTMKSINKFEQEITNHCNEFEFPGKFQTHWQLPLQEKLLHLHFKRCTRSINSLSMGMTL